MARELADPSGMGRWDWGPGLRCHLLGYFSARGAKDSGGIRTWTALGIPAPDQPTNSPPGHAFLLQSHVLLPTQGQGTVSMLLEEALHAQRLRGSRELLGLQRKWLRSQRQVAGGRGAQGTSTFKLSEGGT